MTPLFRRASSDDLRDASAVLAEAFRDYSWTRWVLPDDGYEHRLAEIQGLYLAHALEHGLVIVNGTASRARESPVCAVAAFLPDSAPPPAVAVQERVAELHGDRLNDLLSVRTPDPPAGSWALETVGVRPTCQGAGLGSSAVAYGLSVLDEERARVALETSDERNVRLYRRIGFEPFATTRTAGGPIVYSMLREAR